MESMVDCGNEDYGAGCCSVARALHLQSNSKC